MKILLISYAFPPMLTPRSIQISHWVKYWYRKGLHTTVVAAEPKTTIEQIDLGLPGFLPLVETYFTRSFEYKLIWLFMRAFFPMLLWLPDSKIGWYLTAIKKCRRLLSQNSYDIVLTCAQPYTSHLVGLKLKEVFGMPWVAHFSDPWVDNPYLKFCGPRHKALISRLEKKVMEKADRIIFVSEETKEVVLSRYSQDLRGKSLVIPHCFDPEIYPSDSRSYRDTLVISHVGHFYGQRSPKPFLRALDHVLKNGRNNLDKVVVQFVGSIKRDDRKLVHKLGLESVVHFINCVSYKESLKYIMSADILLIFDAVDGLKSVFFPSKLVEYLGSGRRILAFTPRDSSTCKVLSSLGHLSVDPADEDLACSILYKLIQDRKTFKDLYNTPYYRNFHADCVTEEFIRLFNQLKG